MGGRPIKSLVALDIMPEGLPASTGSGERGRGKERRCEIDGMRRECKDQEGRALDEEQEEEKEEDRGARLREDEKVNNFCYGTEVCSDLC